MSASFAEIAVTTNFSFLRGASHPKELVAAAAFHGHVAIGIADRNTLAGVVRAYEGLNEVREKTGKTTKLLVGARLVFVDGTPDILAYPTDRPAYGRLCRLLSAGKLRAAKGECILTLDDLLERQEGLLLVIMPPHPAREEASGDPFKKSWNTAAAPTDGNAQNKSVTPAEAGTQSRVAWNNSLRARTRANWVSASAGMTRFEDVAFERLPVLLETLSSAGASLAHSGTL